MRKKHVPYLRRAKAMRPVRKGRLFNQSLSERGPWDVDLPLSVGSLVAGSAGHVPASGALDASDCLAGNSRVAGPKGFLLATLP